MNQEEIQKSLEAIGKGGIQVNGDFVVSKHVENEIGNVEAGGIGIQIVNGKDEPQSEINKPQSIDKQKQEGESEEEEMTFFIHPRLEEEEGRRTHNEIKRLVARQGIQEICRYLLELMSNKKVLLPQNAERAYNELVRLGMPNGDGYSLKTFTKYYKR